MQRRYRTTICLLSLLGCVLVLFVRCIPARSLWDFDVTPDYCFSASILVDYATYAGSKCHTIMRTIDAITGKLIASLVFSAFTDLYLALYPATVFFTLQMNWTKKLALSAALGVGSGYGVLRLLPLPARGPVRLSTSGLAAVTQLQQRQYLRVCQRRLARRYRRLFRGGEKENGEAFPHSRCQNQAERLSAGIPTGKKLIQRLWIDIYNHIRIKYGVNSEMRGP